MRSGLFLFGGLVSLGLAVAWGQGTGGGKQAESGVKSDAAPPSPPAAATKAATVPAAHVPIAARSRVVKVTVYPNSALVTREVEVPPGDGLAELVVSGLPERVQNSSLYSEGSEGVRVLSTRFRTQPVLEHARDDVRRLEDEMNKLQLAAQKIQGEVKTAQKNLQMLAKLEAFTEKTTVHSTEKGGLNGDTVITLAKYVMEQRAEKNKELVTLQQDLQKNQEHAQFAQRKLADLTKGSARVERDAVIVVDRDNGGGPVRLNYLVDAASWRPQYKLRSSGNREAVQVDYLAALVQQTGEDWSHVDVTLSTARPMLSAAPPELRKLEVTVVARAAVPAAQAAGRAGAPGMPVDAFTNSAPMQRELERKAIQLRQEAITNYNTNKDMDKAESQINAAAAYEQTRDLMKSREEVVHENRFNRKATAASGEDGPSVTYHLRSRLTVPSRNDEQVIEIAKLALEPKYYYKAVPVLSPHVYRLADLSNRSEHVLLPGEATMYQGTDFVGRMTMPLVAVGEEFTAGFGVEPQLQVQRQMIDKARTTQGGNQVLNYKYRILVNSYKSEPALLQVWDRLPHAETETAGVTLVKATPDLSKDALYERENRPSNLLRWDVQVEPNRSGEKAQPIHYEFRLELDRNMALTGLQSR